MKLQKIFKETIKEIKILNLKNIFKLINKETLLSTLIILIILFGVIYIIPDILETLFNTILGNLILLLIIIILIITKKYKFGIFLLLIIIILYRFNYYKNKKEGFTWSQDSINQFIKVQNTINPKIIFDTNEIQKQASQDEVNYFLKTGMWPWSQEVQQLYKKAILTNPYVRTDPEDALNTTRKIYNQTIILEMLSSQTKEGQFLLKGVSIDSSNNNIELNGWGNYGYKSGLQENQQNENIIRCGIDASGNNSLQQIQYNSSNNTQTITPIDYNNLTSLIPGFSFKNSSCNPCVALNSTPDYTCPFNLDISGNINQGTSTIWQYLWNTNPFESIKSVFLTNENSIDPNKFPILNEINTEINTLFQK